jgi:hypothetical protein
MCLDDGTGLGAPATVGDGQLVTRFGNEVRPLEVRCRTSRLPPDTRRRPPPVGRPPHRGQLRAVAANRGRRGAFRERATRCRVMRPARPLVGLRGEADRRRSGRSGCGRPGLTNGWSAAKGGRSSRSGRSLRRGRRPCAIPHISRSRELSGSVSCCLPVLVLSMWRSVEVGRTQPLGANE